MDIRKQIVYKKTSDLKPYEKNPRKNDQAVPYVAESIKEFNFQSPIIIDKDGTIVCGHTRWKAAKKLGLNEVPCIIADDLTPQQIKAFRLADNKVAEKAEWDDGLLDLELADLTDLDMGAFGFEEEDLHADKDAERKYKDAKAGMLLTDFIVPPLSVLDTRLSYWKDRKAEWHEVLPDSRDGREDTLLGDGLKQLAINICSKNITGTSEFDPVLCEIIYQWFCPKGGVVIDPFAGGHVRGTIADVLGLHYTGIELRPEQVQANNEVKEQCGIENAEWICDDSLNVNAYIPDNSADFILACPPYADLEVYSDDPRDISNMEYDQFLRTYKEIIKRFIAKLKENRFAVFVVGDVRDKKGFYRDFISDTKKAFIENGMNLYNELILIESGASAALRAGNTFRGMRKTVKMHQNVLVFYKGETLPQHKHVLVFYRGNPQEIKGLDLTIEDTFDARKDAETKPIIRDMIKKAEKSEEIKED